MGHWKNFDEMENNLSLPELESILEASRRTEYNRQKFAAALKGVNLEESSSDTSFEDIKRRAQAKLKGVSEEQVSLNEIGITIVEE